MVAGICGLCNVPLLVTPLLYLPYRPNISAFWVPSTTPSMDSGIGNLNNTRYLGVSKKRALSGALFLRTPTGSTPQVLATARYRWEGAIRTGRRVVAQRGQQQSVGAAEELGRASLPLRVVLWALVMGPFDSGGVCSMGPYFVYGT